MKLFLIIILAFFFSVISYSQVVNYAYDDSGNRTSRTITLSKSLLSETESAKSQERITEQVAEQTIIVYPNPVKEEVNVEISGFDDTRGGSVFLFDQSGRLLVTQSRILTRNTFNLSRYPAGIYFIIIQLGNNKSKYTIIKD
jgi:hypothetical protein